MRLSPRAAVVFAAILTCAPPIYQAAAQGGRADAGVFDPRTGRFAFAFPQGLDRAADTVAAPLPRVWAALTRVYADQGIPVTIVDTASHALGAIRATQRRPVAGRRLSTVLECGTGAYGPNAERYTVQLTVLSAVRGLPDGRSVVDSRVGGVAAPNGLNSSVNCESTGVLEDLIAQELRTHLAP